MSQAFRLGEPGPLAILLALLCLTTACAAEAELAMRQPFGMGPWTFEVRSATERIEPRGGQQVKIVSIELKLLNYHERHEKPFDDFLNGHTHGSVMAFPHLKLVDRAGTQFDGWLVPSSGGSLRSEAWRAEFVLVPSNEPDPMSSTADMAGKYLDTRLSELRLAIDNPDQREGQPYRVSVKLQ